MYSNPNHAAARLQQKVSALSSKLAKSEQEKEALMFRLASFTEFNPRPITEVDFQGKVIYMNPSFRTEFPDFTRKKLQHPYLADFGTIAGQFKKGQKSFIREVQIKKKWYRQNFYYIPTLNLIRIFGLDITDKKNLEDHIKESEARYHLLFEKMNYGYALQDVILNNRKKPSDYRFVDVNPAFEKLTGLRKKDIIGKTANQISQTPQTKESLVMRKEYNKVALTGKPMFFETYNEKMKKYFELYAYQPNVNQIALIFSDITNRKKTDEEKNNFIAIMSHELRNPLTPILANAQFIKSILPEQNVATATIRNSIAIIEMEAKTMANLLNDILDVSRLSRQKIQLRKTRVNIYDIVKRSVETSIPFINIKDQDLKVFFSQEPLYANADPLRLEQVIINIINNASKYTPPKGVIRIHCSTQGEQIRIRIKDNGIGMDKDKIKRIFELFNSDSQPFMGIGGLGIGLNIVKNLVTMHGGTVEVKSVGKDKGSEFTIYLPKEKISFPALENPAALQPANTTHPLRILIVEDNKNILNALSQLLTSHGHQVKTSHDGFEGIKISHTFKPDVALIDIGLPGMNGYELAKKIRLSGNTKIRLIAVTGFGQEKDIAEAKASGFDHHMIKPIDINQLLKLLY